MSFTLSISGHSDDQDQFENILDGAAQFVSELGDSCDGATFSGTDNNGVAHSHDLRAEAAQTTEAGPTVLGPSTEAPDQSG